MQQKVKTKCHIPSCGVGEVIHSFLTIKLGSIKLRLWLDILDYRLVFHKKEMLATNNSLFLYPFMESFCQ